jgi:hypothetical protein
MIKGLGCALALPWLEAMGWSADGSDPSQPGAAPPRRLAYIFTPNGTFGPDWPEATGSDITALPPTLQPLAPVIDDVLVIKGLDNPIAYGEPNIIPGHRQATAAWLTCVIPWSTDLGNRVGISVDQVAARAVGDRTMLPSLELAVAGSSEGNCTVGNSCAYVDCISWQSASEPSAKETSPQAVYNRLFRDVNQPLPAQQAAVHASVQRSILDLVKDQGASLKAGLGFDDRQRLDGYLDSVRAVERRIQRGREWGEQLRRAGGAPKPPDSMPPPQSAISYQELIHVMLDLLVLAFQSDATRIATFPLASDSSQARFEDLGVNEGHHGLSHHEGIPERIAQLKKVDGWYVGRFRYLLEKMRAVKEGDGTLLDHSMIVYGASCSNGNAHNVENLPILLAGRGGGSIRPGRFLQCPKGERFANLHLAMLQRMGVDAASFGDSTRPLEGLQ